MSATSPTNKVERAFNALAMATVFLYVGVVALFGVGFVSNGNRVAEAKANSAANAQTITQLEAAVRILCDRAYILDGIVLDLQRFVGPVRADYPGKEEFVKDMRQFHRQLVFQITDKSSPCAR